MSDLTTLRTPESAASRTETRAGRSRRDFEFLSDGNFAQLYPFDLLQRIYVEGFGAS